MNDESKIFGISVRAFILIVLTISVCSMAMRMLEIKEPLYSAFLIALGFFYGQKTQTKGGGNV
jgi:hypothetical protein